MVFAKHVMLIVIILCNLYQHSAILNCDNKVLDLVLASENLEIPYVIRNSSSFVPVDVYHPPTHFIVNQNVKFLDETEHRQYNFRKANYEQVNEAIGGINWNFIHLLSVEQALHQFYKLINGIIRGFCSIVQEKQTSIMV